MMQSEARSQAAPSASPPIEPVRENPVACKKVLVVEDVALIRMSTVDMVQELGFETAEAGDGVQALATLKDDLQIDVLLTDLGLPVMSGRQLIEEALRLKPSLKVIVASGYSTEGGTAPEGVRTLMKPFDINQLRAVLEE
jgi:CheY-like chemotaxis protein